MAVERTFKDEKESTEFSVSDVPLSRDEVRIKNRIDRIKDDCSNLSDNNSTVKCFTLAQEMDREFDNVLRESRGRQRIEKGPDRSNVLEDMI